LGVSIKINKNIDPKDEIIEVKGMTQGFCTPVIVDAYANQYPVSRHQLFQSDKFALIESFRRASMRCKPLLKEPGQTPLYDLMLKDLEEKSISDTI
jgi:hypothetical protein